MSEKRCEKCLALEKATAKLSSQIAIFHNAQLNRQLNRTHHRHGVFSLIYSCLYYSALRPSSNSNVMKRSQRLVDWNLLSILSVSAVAAWHLLFGIKRAWKRKGETRERERDLLNEFTLHIQSVSERNARKFTRSVYPIFPSCVIQFINKCMNLNVTRRKKYEREREREQRRQAITLTLFCMCTKRQLLLFFSLSWWKLWGWERDHGKSESFVIRMHHWTFIALYTFICKNG